jgi:transposase
MVSSHKRREVARIPYMESDVSRMPHEIEASQVQHLPIVRAYADKMGLVEVVNQRVATEMEVDPGTIVLGLVLDTVSGRSPLYRLEEFFAQQDTELLLGKEFSPHALNDDTVGRVLDRLFEVGTMKIFTACAVRADTRWRLDKHSVHFDTTSMRVYGDSRLPEERALPFTITHGYSKDKRPDLQQFVLSMLCVDHAVPIWGQPEDGNASDKTLHTTILSEIAQILAPHGVEPRASIYIADAALGTEDKLAALGDTLFISRFPATYNECARVIQEAVTHETWGEGGLLAQPQPTPPRPGASYKTYESAVTLDGKPYRAVVVQSSAQEKRRLKRLDRALQASAVTLRAAVQGAEKQEYFCRADAEAAAEALRARQTDSHQIAVTVEERPQDGKGRPSPRTPRQVKAMRYGLTSSLREHSANLATKRAEAGGFVWLTNGPQEGPLAHGAGEVLKAYQEQYGVEQNFGFLKAPLIVNSLFLKKPERIEALGLGLLLALLIWRVMERTMRAHVDATGPPLTGWEKKKTTRPTACMMVTKFAGLIVLRVEQQRQLAQPFSAVQRQYLTALGLPAACCTTPSSMLPT